MLFARIDGLIWETAAMPRYLIERNFPDGLGIPADEIGARLCGKVIENNAEDGVP